MQFTCESYLSALQKRIFSDSVLSSLQSYISSFLPAGMYILVFFFLIRSKIYARLLLNFILVLTVSWVNLFLEPLLVRDICLSNDSKTHMGQEKEGKKF